MHDSPIGSMLAGALLLSACAGDGIGPLPCDPSVRVTPSQIALKPGESRQVRVAADFCGDRSPVTLEWRSQAPSVATVRTDSDTTATVVAVAPGTVQLLVTASTTNNRVQHQVPVAVER